MKIISGLILLTLLSACASIKSNSREPQQAVGDIGDKVIMAETKGTINCWVNSKSGHIDFNENTQAFNAGEPFGIVKLSKVRSDFYLSYIINAQETILNFRNDLSLTKQKPLGIAGAEGAGLGNIVCK